MSPPISSGRTPRLDRALVNRTANSVIANVSAVSPGIAADSSSFHGWFDQQPHVMRHRSDDAARDVRQ